MINSDEFKISQDAIKIGQAVTAGILLEVSCSPSPGLVSPFSMGSHEDMNFLSFMLGSSAISPYFSLFGQMGMDWDEKACLLDELRAVGIYAEKDLLRKTSGINTQRGILFLGGVVAAASGIALRMGEVSINRICKNVSKVCEGIVERELKGLNGKSTKTNGEKVFLKYGIRGIRGEVEDGFPSIVNISYPQFVEAIDSGVGLNYAMINSLLHLIMVVEDTTVISRLGMTGLQKAQIGARKVIEKGSVYTKEGRNTICDLDKYFIEENISPGGCADLLAITIAISILEGKKIDLNQILKVIE